ncbi:fimbrial protein [Providencia hangzhouensis]
MTIGVAKIALGSSLLWPLLSWGMTVNNTPGDIVMQGELIEPHVRLILKAENFGLILVKSVPERLLLKSICWWSKNFAIKLVGCTLPSNDKGSASRAQITMMGTSVNDDQLLQVSGDSEGFGIQFRDSHGEILKLNRKMPDYTLLEGRKRSDFTAILVAYQKHIKAGDFAGVRFRMDYF